MRAESAAFLCVGIQYTRKTRKIPIGARRKIGDLVHLISPSDARIRHCPNAIASPSETAMPPVLGLRARQVVIFTLNTLSVDADFREIWTGPYRGREGGQNSTPGSGKSHQSPRVDDVDDAKRSRAIILRPFPPRRLDVDEPVHLQLARVRAAAEDLQGQKPSAFFWCTRTVRQGEAVDNAGHRQLHPGGVSQPSRPARP